MIDMAVRNLWQRKTRSSLTVVGVGLAVALYVYLGTIMSFYERDLQRTLAGFAGNVIVQAQSDAELRFPPIGSVILEEQARAVLDLPGVDPERSSAVLLEPIVANPAPSMPPSVMAVGIVPGHEAAFRGDVETLGSESLGDDRQVILGAGAAAHYGAEVGDTLSLRGTDLYVIGIMENDTELVNSAVLMPIDVAQQLFARPGVVSAVMLSAQTIDDVSGVAAAVEAADQSLVASTPADISRAANEMLGPQRAFFASIRGALVAVGVVVVMVVMVMAVSERRREIGTLKALGAKRRHILTLILAESVLLSLVGGIGAIAVAWLLTRSDAMSVDIRLALQSAGVAVAVGVLAALWPVISAQRVDPIESLRYE